MKQDINTKREREKAMVTQMIALYCRKNHHGKALCPDCAKPHTDTTQNDI